MDILIRPNTPDTLPPASTLQPPSATTSSATWLGVLEQRSLPHFNHLVLLVLLACGLVLACWPFETVEGTRQAGLVTLLFWLPAEALRSAWVWWAFRMALVLGSGLWLVQRALPWSCWLAVAGFTGLWSLHVETTSNAAHIFHMANMLLVIQAIWTTAEAPLIRQRLAEGTYWQRPLVPRWVSLTSIAYIGIFHTAAGLSKLWFSGPGWANGTALQIWTYLWGRPWSPTTRMILTSRTFTQLLQGGSLVIETLSVLAIFPKFRVWIGLGLIGFYVGVLATFDYGFQFNALLTALYLLPCERSVTAWAERKLP